MHSKRNKTKTFDAISIAAALATSASFNKATEHKAVVTILQALVDDKEMWNEIAEEVRKMVQNK